MELYWLLGVGAEQFAGGILNRSGQSTVQHHTEQEACFSRHAAVPTYMLLVSTPTVASWSKRAGSMVKEQQSNEKKRSTPLNFLQMDCKGQNIFFACGTLGNP